jgi:hypothetical protein
MRYAWLGRLREPLRRQFFALMAGALDTDDGRALLAQAIGRTLPAWTRSLAPADPRVRGSYPDLGRPDPAQDDRPAPVFITARFRSGSTLLWNLFRHVPGCTAYYEPLNERRWFDPASRGDRVDATHVGVDGYWREYEGLGHLAALFQDRWADRDLLMDEHAWAPELQAYVQALVDAAPSTAVLQFNRVDFRLPWLRWTFPHARLIHLVRHPRDQWCSSLMRPTDFPKGASAADFPPFDRFYLLDWARDLRRSFPFVDPALGQHPYRTFYFIWKLSCLFGLTYGDATFRYEDLVACPQRVVPQIMAAAGIGQYDPDLLASRVAAQPTGKWRDYAEEGWFRGHEQACERVLGDVLGSDRV